jgi:conjugative relaxase-like TrwC/TraI family protein
LLSIGKLVAGQERYYEQQVALGRDDYYADSGEAPGRWTGTGACTLGLEGEADGEAFGSLIAGRDPNTGEVLRTASGRDRVCALDLTFSAPKSVSVLFAIGDAETSRDLVAAHEEAVDAAVGYLEREACRVRRGHGGRVELAAEGFVAAAYRHRMSRAEQPQLHTHVVAANLARGSDGRWSALHGYRIFQHAKGAGSLYQAHLRAAVRERFPWARWGEVRNGMAELEGLPAGVLAHFSRRRAEIEEWLEADGRSGRQSAEKAALATREPKADPVPLAPWSERVRAEAAEHGLGRDELAAFMRGPDRSVSRLVDYETVGGVLAGPAGLTAQRNSFESRHAVAELAAAHRDGASVEDVERATEAFLAREDVVWIVGRSSERRYTTVSLLACERRIVTDAVRGQGSGTAVIDGDLVDRTLARLPVPLNAEQAAAVRTITARGNAVDFVEALAGTGKTTVAGALAAVYQDAGYRVLGAAPTGRAARELSSRAGVPARTLHGLVEDLRQSEGFGPDPAVLLIDEAGMAPTRVSAHVLGAAGWDGVKVVALGDSGQLASVEAGGWFGALSQRLCAHELRSVVRQRDRGERQALAELHDGNPDAWLVLKQERHELVVHHGGPQAAQEAAMAAWRADVDQVGIEQAIMIARDNQTRAQLNDQARRWRERRGELGAEIPVDGLKVAMGDRVIARRNDRALDVDNGTRGTVVAVDTDTQGVTVETDTGQVRALPADYVAEHVEHAYALTGHGTQGATVERAVVVGSPEDFTNEWAYTALSRARDPVHVLLIAERDYRSGRTEIAPARPERTAEEAIEAMRGAMGRGQREDLAIDQLDRAPAQRVTVPGEAAAEATERAQRQQFALDLDSVSKVVEPVPEVLRAVREPGPLCVVDRRIGLDDQHREAIGRARKNLGNASRHELAAASERLDALLPTYPAQRVEAAHRAAELRRLRDSQADAHERIGAQQARLDQLGPLSRIIGREERAFAQRALSNSIVRAQILDDKINDLQRQVDVDRHQRTAWFDEHGDELVELAAAGVEAHDRDDKDRGRRIDAIRCDPPEWVTDRLRSRPDEPTAREHWDRAAAHLDDFRHAFGHLPDDGQPSRSDYRQRHAWEEVHDAATKALDVHPERTVVQRPPPQIHRDIGLDLGR